MGAAIAVIKKEGICAAVVGTDLCSTTQSPALMFSQPERSLTFHLISSDKRFTASQVVEEPWKGGRRWIVQ